MYIDLEGIGAAVLLIAGLSYVAKFLYPSADSRVPSDRVGNALYHSKFELNHLIPLVSHEYLRPEGIDDEIIERCVALYRFGLTRAIAAESNFSLKEQSSAYREIGKDVRKKERDLAAKFANTDSTDPALKFVSLGETTYMEFVEGEKDRELKIKKAINIAKGIVRRHYSESNFLRCR